MRFLRFLSLVAMPSVALSLATVFALVSTPVTAAKMQNCSLWAHVNDADPKGAHVRAKPAKNSKSLTRLTKFRRGKRLMVPVVNITGQTGNWFRIAKAGRDGKSVFAGRGWIHRSLLAVQIRGNTALLAKPEKGASITGNVGDVEAEGSVRACQGSWLKVRHKTTKGTVQEGWINLNSYCAGWETTCS